MYEAIIYVTKKIHNNKQTLKLYSGNEETPAEQFLFIVHAPMPRDKKKIGQNKLSSRLAPITTLGLYGHFNMALHAWINWDCVPIWSNTH